MQFAGTLASADTYLPGAGNIAADGYPVPYAGYIQQLWVWDAANMHSDADQIAIASGDRLSIYCDDNGTDSTVYVRKNGANTTLKVLAIARTATIEVTIGFSQNIA